MLIDRLCLYCGKGFRAHDYEVRRGRGNYCGKSCATSHNQLGNLNSKWNGGKSEYLRRQREYAASYRADHQEEIAARSKANVELKCDPSAACEICREYLPLDKHHQDYDKPLEVN